MGLQFKQNEQWSTAPATAGMNVEYCKFKLYREGVLCSEFTSGKDYDYFTSGDTQRQIYVDQNELALSYTVGYTDRDAVYKYYIPLYIQNSVTTTATKYTLTADIKLGGMVRTISQDFVLVRDDIVAPAGTAIWGLINNAYTTQFGETYEGDRAFYRSICKVLTGTIGVGGQYKSGANWVTVSSDYSQLTNLIYNGETILKYLPNITGIDLHGASSLTHATDNIVSMDLSYINDLHTFNIDGCSSLNVDYDLSNFTNITTVDASGTNVNVLIPTDSGITTYELGTPTEVSIVRPTDLVPAGIVVDGYKNITDLEIIKGNSQTCNAYNMFGKVMENYFGKVTYDMRMDSSGNYNSTHYESGRMISDIIYVADVTNLKIETDAPTSYYIGYDSDGQYVWQFDTFTENLKATWHRPIIFIRVSASYTDKTYYRVINADTDEVLFEWRK